MAQEWTWERVGVIAGAVVGVYGAVQLTGFTFDPPWAKAEDVRAIQQQVQTIKDGFSNLEKKQDDQNKVSLRIQRVQMMAQLKEAQDDLRANPNSVSAAKAVQDARDAIAAIDKELAK